MKKPARFVLSLLLVAFAAFDYGGQAPPATVHEEVSQSGTKMDQTLGSVFDLRNPLKLHIDGTLVAASSSQPDPAAQEIQDLVAIVNAANTGLAKLAPLSTHPADIKTQDVPSFAKELVAANLIVGRYPDLKAQVEARFVPQGEATKDYLFAFNVIKTAAASLQAKIQASLLTQQFKVTVTVTQSRENHPGRSYPQNLADLFAATQADMNAAQQLNATALENQVKQIGQNFINGLESKVETTFDPPFKQLTMDLGADNASVKKIQTDLDALKNTTLTDPQLFYNQVSTTFSDIQTVVNGIPGDTQTIQNDLKALGTAIQTIVTALPGDLRDLLQALGLANDTAQIAQEVQSYVLSEGQVKDVYIGVTDDPNNPPQFPLTLQNGDKVRIQVASKPSTAPDGQPGTPLLDTSSRAFRMGWNPVMTLTFDGTPEKTSDRIEFEPSINLTMKDFRRGPSARNMIDSVGFGLSWFPVGVDQSNSASQQFAGGIAISLLDDWLVVGYARNFSLNYYFPFIGVTIPFNLAK